MTDELRDLLIEFDSPMPVASVTYNLHGQVKYFPVPGLLSGAANDGLIKSVIEDEKVVNSDRVYGMDLVLTDKGRIACGLPPVQSDKPKPKKAATLFD